MLTGAQNRATTIYYELSDDKLQGKNRAAAPQADSPMCFYRHAPSPFAGFMRFH
jgi:hypothetical protein